MPDKHERVAGEIEIALRDNEYRPEDERAFLLYSDSMIVASILRREYGDDDYIHKEIARVARLDALEEVKQVAIGGLLTDGGHHKQWYLEKILGLVVDDVDAVKQELLLEGYEWEAGIAP